MNESIFILKGNIVYSKSQTEFAFCEHGYLVCKDGKVDGIYQTLPFRLGGSPIRDYGDCLIIPGLVDLHVHAPQYSYRGLGMDMELLEWLERNAPLANDVDSVTNLPAPLIKYTIPDTNKISTVSKKEYFLNAATDWYCILSGYPAATSFVDNIYENILNVDLLIIDDLGTEGKNGIKLTELFNILNTRLLNNKSTKTIISTNLSLQNLFNNYDERIVSRIVGNYNICYFFGDDIRFRTKAK